MFLFLSKLLPLFIYPLGFASVMMVIAALSLWKRPRFASGCLVLALLAILVPSSGWVSTQLVRSLEWQYIPTSDLPKADAIVVLGGAIRPATHPRPWVEVSEAGDRPIYAARLYKQGKAPLIILSGGRIAWQGSGPPESQDMTQLVEAMGVPATAIAEDPTSLNTYQNAVNVKKIMQDRGIRRILLVTSAMHMPRSMQIFRRQGMEAIAAPTDFLISDQNLKEATTTEAQILNLLPDAENLQNSTRALKEHVGLIVYRLLGWA